MTDPSLSDKDQPPRPLPSHWQVIKVLWKAARRRAAGRARRQRELRKKKTGSSRDALGTLSFAASFVLWCLLHAVFAWLLLGLPEPAAWMKVEYDTPHQRAVSYLVADDLERCKHARRSLQSGTSKENDSTDKTPTEVYADELQRFARLADVGRREMLGGDDEQHEKVIKSHAEKYGPDGFTAIPIIVSYQTSLAHGPLLWLASSVLLCLWFVALAFQGEGMELDFQRRRHPMWEWLFTHPVAPQAAFVAEFLTPFTINPFYLAAMFFWPIVWSFSFGFNLTTVGLGVFGGLFIALAGSIFNKSIETWVLLRMAPRKRGAFMGIMSWLGYTATLLPLLLMKPEALNWLVKKSQVCAELVPDLLTLPARWLIIGWSEQAGVGSAFVTLCGLAVVMMAVAMGIAATSTSQGLQAHAPCGSLALCLIGMGDHHWTMGMAHHLLGHATHDEPGKSRPAMRGHDDEIRTSLFCDRANFMPWGADFHAAIDRDIQRPVELASDRLQLLLCRADLLLQQRRVGQHRVFWDWHIFNDV